MNKFISAFNSSQWVFSKKTDLLVFFSPILVGLLAFFFYKDNAPKNFILWRVLVVWFLDIGHVFATIVPVYLDKRASRVLGHQLFIVPITLLIFSMSLAQLNSKVFEVVLAYVALTHIIRQQYGWFRLITRVETLQSSFEKVFDRIIFWNVFLVPVFFWHTDLNHIPRTYFFQNDLILNFNSHYWAYINFLHWLLNFLFLTKCIYNYQVSKKNEFGKIMLLFSGWIWFYVGLVILQSSIFFWSILIITHGLAYHIHINNYWKICKSESVPEWFKNSSLKRNLIYLIAIIFLSVSWNSFWASSFFYGRLSYFYWMALITHYTFDFFIWKKESFVYLN